MSQFLIYGLRDPRTREIRYVGQSSTGMQRPRRHAHEHRIRESTPAKRNWLRKLQRLGLKYEIVVLEQVECADQLNDAEVRWVAIGRAALGDRLLNCSDGGQLSWGHTPSEATKAKIRASCGSSEFRARMSAIKLDGLTDEQLLRSIAKQLERVAAREAPLTGLHLGRRRGPGAPCTKCGGPRQYPRHSYCRLCLVAYTRSRNSLNRRGATAQAA